MRRKKHSVQGKRSGDILKAAAGVSAALILTIIGCRYAPSISRWFSDSHLLETARDALGSMGFWGVLSLCGLQVLQNIFAFLPSEPIELLAGMVYGPWWGYAVCALGVVVGSTLVFTAVKRLGKRLAHKIYANPKLQKLDFLQNERKLGGICAVLYFIPGLPKDLFTYAVALTPLDYPRFIMISTLFRIPSILSSTIAGQRLIAGDVSSAVIIFGVFMALGALGSLVYGLLIRHKEKARTAVKPQQENFPHPPSKMS